MNQILKYLNIQILFFLCLSCQLYCQQIHVLYTSALLPKQYELRKQEYITSFYTLRSYGYEPWIIEATNISSSFFDEISNQVLYPQKNDLSLINKGVNEAMSIRASLPFLPFGDNDIVIKLTGRYLLYDRFFITVIEKSLKRQYDAYVLYGKHFVSADHIFTGCFAMRWKYFKKMILQLDFEFSEKYLIPIEKSVADFIKINRLKEYRFDKLHMLARIYHSGDDETSPPLEF